MGRIDDLIQKYCPEGVKMCSLSEIGDFYSGLSGKTKDDFKDGNAKFISYVNIYNNPSLNIDVEDKVKVADGEKQNTIQYGDLLFTGSSETPDECGMCSVLTQHTEEKLYLNSFCFGFRFFDLSDKCPYFMKHLFRSKSIRKKIGRTANGVTRYNISKKEFSKIQIPLPPLKIQEEIGEILEKFDRLSAELQAELQARKQQYEYYRNQLLTRFAPNQPVTEYSLGELGTITRGNGLQKKDFTESGVGCIHYGQIYTRYKTFTEKTLTYVDESLAKKLLHVEKGDLVIACTSENVEDVCKCVAWLGEDTIVTGGHACVYRHNQNPKYMAYFFQTDYFFQQKKKYAYGAKVIDIKPDSIAKITIPLPSLEEQARIVAILDKFEALVNDLSQGLPAEIAAVQEQYEYYRNKLLTFKTKE